MPTYPAVKKCIYCGTSGVKLTDEHIAPAGLNGEWVLPKSSCNRCQKITAKLENYCLRSMLGRTRITLNMRTRRPKERPSTLPLYKKDAAGVYQPVDVPAGASPPFMAMPILPIARLFRGLAWSDEPVDMSLWIWPGPDSERLRKEILDQGADRVTGEINPILFLRMIAKVAHGYVCAERGVDSFVPYTTRFILGEDDTLNTYVGTGYLSNGTITEGIEPVGQSTWMLSQTTNASGEILATVRLFGELGAPTYHVAVGKDRRACASQYNFGRSKYILTRL